MKCVRGDSFSNIDVFRDMHTHPFEKGKSLEAMETFVLRAIELGLSEIAFSDHAPMDERIAAGHAMSIKEMDIYYDFSMKLKNKYKDIINVIIGIEADYHPLNFSMIEKLKKKYSLDFMIGAFHLHIPGWKNDIAGFSVLELIDFSFEQSQNLINSGLFDTFAHFDRFRDILHEFSNYYLNPKEQKDKFINLFKAVKRNGIILEINPSKCNTPSGGSMESFFEIIQWSKDLELEYVFGSDAHWAHDVNKFFFEFKNSLKSVL